MRPAFALLLMLSFLVPARALDPRTIAPGVGIGHTLLRMDINKATRGLGPQQDGDAALGHFWSTWYGKSPNGRRTELDIYSVCVGDGRHTLVEQVRVTSPYFRTASGVGAGSTLAQVKAAFPAARPVASHSPDQTYHMGSVQQEPPPAPHVFIDDRAAGVAFEFARKNGVPSGLCVSVLVHPRGISVTDEYSAWPYNY